jgi:basic membrane protein A
MILVDNAVFNVVSDLNKGIFKGGTTVEYGLKDGAVDIAPSTSKMVPSILLEDLAKIKKDIVAGKIKIPSNEKAYAAFIKTVK